MMKYFLPSLHCCGGGGGEGRGVGGRGRLPRRVQTSRYGTVEYGVLCCCIYPGRASLGGLPWGIA